MPFVAATRYLGRAGLFSLSVLRASKPTADFFADLIREIYKIGARSLPIIAVGGAFVGLSVTLLGYRALETYGAAKQIRELVGARKRVVQGTSVAERVDLGGER